MGSSPIRRKAVSSELTEALTVVPVAGCQREPTTAQPKSMSRRSTLYYFARFGEPSMAQMTAAQKSDAQALADKCEALGLDWSKVFALIQTLLPLILDLFKKEPPGPQPAQAG